MRKNLLEIVGNFPAVYSICWRCILTVKASKINLPATDLENVPDEIKNEYLKISHLIEQLNSIFLGKINFRFIDSKTLLGVWKTIRHRIRKTPCFILNGKKLFEGLSTIEQLKNTIEKHIA